MFRTAVSTLIVFHALLNIAAAQSKWTENLPVAMKQAKAEGKDLLLNFTGSDWCHWCHVLEDEVFATKAFRKYAPKHFVLVTLDFPAEADKQNPKLAKQNHEWREKLQIDGFPTIVLCDASGRPYATTGYEEGGPKPYIDQLNEFIAIRKKRDRLMAEAEKCKGLDRARKLDEALSIMPRSIVASCYQKEIDEVLKLAPEDKPLVKRFEQYRLYSQQQQALGELEELALSQDKKEVLEKLKKFEHLFENEGEDAAEFQFLRLNILLETKLFDEALKASEEVLKSDSEDIRGMAADMHVQSLIRLGRHAEALQAIEKFEDDFEEFERIPLQFYKIDALVKLGKKREALRFAATLEPIAKRLAEESGAVFIEDALKQFIASNGEGRAFVDAFNEPPEISMSDFWIGAALQSHDRGLQVQEVIDGAPAEKAGVRRGDVIVSIDGEPMNEIQTLIEKVGSTGPEVMKVELLRDGEVEKVDLTPEERPEMENGIELAAVPDSWKTAFEDACAKAKQEEKELLLFFSAKWCGPCQSMLKEVFTDEKVETAMKDRIAVYVDLESKSGMELADEFRIEALPTCLFLDSKKKELGRAIGYMETDVFLKALEKRSGGDWQPGRNVPAGRSGEGFSQADADGNGRITQREFRRYSREKLGDGVPLQRLFGDIDKDKSNWLSEDEFADRFRVLEKYVSQPVTEAYADPGRGFVAYPGGAKPVNDAKVFGALVHRYKELVESDATWPKPDITKTPASIERPDFSSAHECKTAADLAKASLIIAGGGEEEAGFFTAGAVVVSADGLAITNYHVVEDIADVKLMAMDADGKVHRVVEVLAGNKERDVALIRIEGEGFHAVRIAGDAPVAGDDLVMMHHSEMRFFTYDRGYVMRYAMISKQPWMEVSAEYAPGGSGCGIFNRKHELVGLVSSITMGDGPDLASDDSLENEDSELEEWGDEEPVTFGALVVKHAVPWSAIDSLWKK